MRDGVENMMVVWHLVLLLQLPLVAVVEHLEVLFLQCHAVVRGHSSHGRVEVMHEGPIVIDIPARCVMV